jgi:hypothetical protein
MIESVDAPAVDPPAVPFIGVPAALMHDLRTPLGHIIGYSELMIEQATEAGDDKYLRHLQKMRAAGWLMLQLLDDRFRSIRPVVVSAMVVPLPKPALLKPWWMNDPSAAVSLTDAFRRVSTTPPDTHLPARGEGDVQSWEGEGGSVD